MITETILENGLIRRQSDRGVYIRNDQTGGRYTYADDVPNEIKVKLGFEPYSYVETEELIKETNV